MTKKKLVKLLTDEKYLDYCKHYKSEYKELEKSGLVKRLHGFVFITKIGENLIDTLSRHTDNA